MKTAFKWVVYSLLTLAALLLLLLIVLVIWVNPNDYRDDISRIARDSAGVELTLGGDLSWRFYPILGFGANEVTLALQAGQPSLVKIDQLALGVRLLPLLSKTIEVDALAITGLKASLLVDEDGKNNWQLAAESETETASPSPETAPATLPELQISLLRISDSRIHYQDRQAQLDYVVDLSLLELRDVNLEKAFPLVMEAKIADKDKLAVTLQLESQVHAQQAEGQYGMQNLQLTAQVAGVFANPVTVQAQGDIAFDQRQDQAEIQLRHLQFANLVANAELAASQLGGELRFNGRMASEVFDPRALMKALAMAIPETNDPNVLTKAQISASFSGTANSIAIKPLVVTLDASTLSGEVAIADLQKQVTRFALQLDQLDADRYLPPATEKTASAAGPSSPEQKANDELIPVETLRGLNLQGTLKAGNITFQQIPLRDIAVSIKANDGEVRIHDLGAKLLQGSLAGSVTLDASTAQPRITTDLRLIDIALNELLQPFLKMPLLSGQTSLTLDVTTQGNDIDALIRQALGQINLNMDNAVLHGVNINQLALDAVKNRLGDFALLLPDYEQKLPKALTENTDIQDLLAKFKVEKGHLILPDFNTSTTEGQLSASGDLDLLNQGFDYRIGVVLAVLSDNKYLKGIELPVHCKGNLASPVTEWCRPDSAAVNKVLERAAAQALRDKGAKQVGEKLGIEGSDEAAVKEELRQKAKAEEDRAKKKLKESLDKRLKKYLDKESSEDD